MTAAAGGPAETAAKAFPWRAVLHTGLCLLRLDPGSFWAMTPIEFHAAAGGLAPRAAAMGRAGLAALMAAFPDGGSGDERG